MIKTFLRSVSLLAAFGACLATAQEPSMSSASGEAERAAREIYQKANELLGLPATVGKTPYTQKYVTHWIILFNCAQASKKPYRNLALLTVLNLVKLAQSDEKLAKATPQNGHRFSFYPYQNELYRQLPKGSNAGVLAGVSMSDAQAKMRDVFPLKPVVDQKGHRHELALKSALEMGISKQLGTKVFVMLTDLDQSDPDSKDTFAQVIGNSFQMFSGFTLYRGTPETISPPEDMSVRLFTENDSQQIKLEGSGPPIKPGGNGPQPPPPQDPDLVPLLVGVFVVAGLAALAKVFTAKVTIQLGSHPPTVIRYGKTIDIYGPGATKKQPSDLILTSEEGSSAEPVKLATIQMGLSPALKAAGYTIKAGGTKQMLNLKKGENRLSLGKKDLSTATLKIKVSK